MNNNNNGYYRKEGYGNELRFRGSYRGSRGGNFRGQSRGGNFSGVSELASTSAYLNLN
jgi:hypothetical protein